MVCPPSGSGPVSNGYRLTLTASNELDMSDNTARIGNARD